MSPSHRTLFPAARSGLLSPHVLALAGVLGLSATVARAQDEPTTTLKEVTVRSAQDVQTLPAPAAGRQGGRWPRAPAWVCWATAM